MRVASWGQDPPPEDWLERRLGEAAALRRGLALDSDAFRLVNAEGDFLPGLVVDVYRRTTVVRPLVRGLEAAMDRLAAQLGALFPDNAVYLKRDEKAARLEGLTLATGYLRGGGDGRQRIREGELELEVDIERGQKTGFYLDQRDSRLLVRRLAAGRRVLNLFAYTGAFALQAAAGGALEAVSVESSRAALELGRACAGLNPQLPVGRPVLGRGRRLPLPGRGTRRPALRPHGGGPAALRPTQIRPGRRAESLHRVEPPGLDSPGPRRADAFLQLLQRRQRPAVPRCAAGGLAAGRPGGAAPAAVERLRRPPGGPGSSGRRVPQGLAPERTLSAAPWASGPGTVLDTTPAYRVQPYPIMRINYALLGFGGIAQSRITREGFGLDGRRFRPHPAAALVGVTDQDRSRRAAAEAHGLRWYDGVEAVLRDRDVQAVFIATNNSSHAPLAERALKAGKHVLVEKPMATRLPDARRLAALARKQGLSLGVDHMMVHNAYSARAVQLLRAGEIGAVSDIVLHMEFLYGATKEEQSQLALLPGRRSWAGRWGTWAATACTWPST